VARRDQDQRRDKRRGAQRCDAMRMRSSLCGLVGHGRTCNARGYVPTLPTLYPDGCGSRSKRGGSVELCGLEVGQAWSAARERFPIRGSGELGVVCVGCGSGSRLVFSLFLLALDVWENRCKTAAGVGLRGVEESRVKREECGRSGSCQARPQSMVSPSSTHDNKLHRQAIMDWWEGVIDNQANHPLLFTVLNSSTATLTRLTVHCYLPLRTKASQVGL